MEADLRKVPRWLGPVLPAVLLAALIVVPATTAGAAATGGGSGESMVCLDCHDGQEATLTHGPHRVLYGDDEDVPARVSCTSCHAGVAEHWEDDPEANPMANPARLDAPAAAAVCAACHQGVHQSNQQTLSPHAAGGVSCLDCHRIHAAPVADGQLKQAQPALCYGCHRGVEGRFALTTHHPVEYGVVDCSDCHLRRDDDMARLSWNGTNATCTGCHPQFEGPFPYEHQATVDYSTEGGGCLSCHDPHGSPLPRLLKQPYEAPHFQLCSQCHVVPGHNFNTQHGSDWAGVACSECHVDVHGSYTSRLYLTPTLGAQGCLAVGCHGQ